MDNLNNLRRHWQNLNNTEAPGFSPEARTSCRSVNRRLKMLRFYRTLTIISIVWIILGPLSMIDIGLPLWLCVMTSLFFAIMGILCYSTYQRIQRMDFSCMTVVELMRSVEHITRSRLIHRYVGILLMVPLLSCMFYYFSANKAVLLGGICGLIFGVVIGLINDARMRRYLKEIRSELMTAYE